MPKASEALTRSTPPGPACKPAAVASSARFFQHAQRVLEDRCAGLGQAELAGRAVQQLGVQRPFQARHRLADRRLGRAHLARRLGKGPGLDHPDKGPDIGKIAWLHLAHRIAPGNNMLHL
nr:MULTISPECIES: hypothetical protein [unclassified Massilia]